MGLFGKIKDILFDEEEVVEESAPKNLEVKKPIEEKPQVATEYKPPVVNRPIKKETVSQENDYVRQEVKEYKMENTFPFPDFDEDEFDSVRPIQKPKTTNVLDYERNKRKERKIEHNRLDRVEVVEKKKFKPSPIISPVYGILNEDYVASDITNRGEPVPQKSSISVESVRKKAFGSLDEPIKKEVKEVYKETETVNSYEPIERKEQKVKTIDELLEDTADVAIPLEQEEIIPEIEPVKKEVIEPTIHEKTKTESIDEDTLENDLFDLIDSMYDKGEEEE